jgi:hypothetical protein
VSVVGFAARALREPLAAFVAAFALACVFFALADTAPAAAEGCEAGSNCLSGFAIGSDGEGLVPFDTVTNEAELERKMGLESPDAIVITPDGKSAFAASGCDALGSGPGTVTENVVLGGGEFRTIQVAEHTCASALAVSPQKNGNGDGGYTVWAAMGAVLFPIDTADDSVGTPIILPNPCPTIEECPDETVAVSADDIALSPDGETLYVLEQEEKIFSNGQISTSALLARFDLTSSPPAELPQSGYMVGEEGESLAIAPDGQTAYMTGNFCEDSFCLLSPLFSVDLTNPEHTATKLAGTGLSAAGKVLLSPDGETAYISEQPELVHTGSSIAVADLSANPVTVSSIDPNGTPGSLAITPDGEQLYAGLTGTDLIRGIQTDDNALNATIPMPEGAGAPTGIAITPAQAPVAALEVDAGIAESPSKLDASGSSIVCNEEQCSSIEKYVWDFGDGSASEETSGPVVFHRYSGPGPYTASVTETSSQGVSTTSVYNGHEMVVNGGPQATASEAFTLPTLATRASADVGLGGSVTDTATLSEGSNETGAIGFALYPPSDPDCEGTPVFTDTVPVNGDGEYRSGAFRPTTMGTFEWVAIYTGDSSNPPRSGNCGDANESVTVTRALPSVLAKAGEGGPVGGTVAATATVSGGHAPTGSITFELFGPDDPSCSRPPVATEAVALKGRRASSGPLTPPVAGLYRWRASYSGDSVNFPVRGECGGAEGSVSVSRATPSLGGSATATAALGDSIADSVTLAGGYRPTGTITFRLAAPGDVTCSAAPVYTAVVPVAGDGSTVSGPFTPLATGEYRWQASYSGDPNNDPVTGSCAEVGQSSAVAPAPAKPPLATVKPLAPPAVPEADLDVSVSGPSQGTAGKPVTFSVTIADEGPAAAGAISLTNTFSGPIRVARRAGTACTGARSIVCSFATLAPGKQIRVRLVVVPQRAGRLTLTSTVRSDSEDPRPGNDRAGRTIPIAARSVSR